MPRFSAIQADAGNSLRAPAAIARIRTTLSSPNISNEDADAVSIPRKDITPGMRVHIVLNKDQRTGTLPEGVVGQLLTKSPTHPHGIKVRLENGQVGRVKAILNN